MSKTDLTTVEIAPDFDTRTLEQQLADAVQTLRAFIARSPKLSHTAASARMLLENVTVPSALTDAQRLEAVREKLRSYENERRLDNVLHHPGDRDRK